MHRYHLAWSKDGTWERIAERLAAAVRQKEGRQGEPSAGIVDARSVLSAATVSKETKGFDAGKKINGRKTFGIVDTLGLLKDRGRRRRQHLGQRRRHQGGEPCTRALHPLRQAVV